MAFERVRGDAYRPSCSVDLLVLPVYQILFCFLDVPHRETRASEHGAKWKHVVAAMEAQFIPAIRDPLSVAGVIKCATLAHAEGGVGNVKRVAGLANLHAMNGELEAAERYCLNVEGLVDRSRPQADWEQATVEATRELLKAIRAGRVEQFFDSQSS